MKKQTMYNRLQEQYNKLNSRIQKAIKTGRFYQLTQFKQDRLFGRLQRYSLQMKRVAAGVAVVAALGVSTPVMGQSPNFVERTGALNPCDTIPGNAWVAEFVDIDNDGDLDMFRSSYNTSFVQIIDYYENTGTVNAPFFEQRVGANNPLDGAEYTTHLEFVDIDGDGDMDCFTRGYNGYSRM